MSTRLFIFGTGSHARKVCHYARDLGWEVVAFVDEAPDACAPVGDIGVIRAFELPEPKNGDAMFVAIGKPEVRLRLMDELAAAGWPLPDIVHRTAWLAPDAVIGDGVLVAAGAVVETAAVVGRGAIIDIGAQVDHDANVGAFAHLRAGQVCGPRDVWPSPIQCEA
jgi:hypothetical protein